MKKVKSLQGQNIYDITLREYGTLDALGIMLQDNRHISLTTKLATNTLLNVRDVPVDAVRARVMAARGIVPATADNYKVEEWSEVLSADITSLLLFAGVVLVVSTDGDGLYVYESGELSLNFTVANSDLHSDAVTAALNNDGFIIGTAAGGLIQWLVATETFSAVVTTSDGLPSNNIRGVLKFSDELNVVLTDDGISHSDSQFIEGATWTNYLAGVDVRHGVMVDDILYMATDAGFITWDGSTFTTIDTGDGLPSDDLRYVMVDSRGVVWLSTEADGLVRIINGNIIITDSSGAFAPTDKPRAMAEDRLGRVLLAFEDDGTRSLLAIIDTANVWQVLDSDDGILPEGTITSLAVDALDNIYVGTSSALHYWNRHPLINI